MISVSDESGPPSDYVNICQTVISKVADTNSVSPNELDQTLNDVIDPDALGSLFEPRNRGCDRRRGRIEFTFAGCDVTVRSSGDVSVSPLEEASAADTENGSPTRGQEQPN
jgi:hypothetical protein